LIPWSKCPICLVRYLTHDTPQGNLIFPKKYEIISLLESILERITKCQKQKKCVVS
jgi:hypothetical protein